ncbi:MAG: hypothetical protein ABH827_02475 [bacterium]
MKIYNKLFIFCLLAYSIGSQQTHATSTQTVQEEAAQAAKLNIMVRSAFKELKPCLGDAIRILKFIKNNSKLMDKVPTILEKVQAKINNAACLDLEVAAMAKAPKLKLKSTCHMYNSNATSIPEATQLLQTIQEKSIANVLIDTLSTISQIISKLSHALAETADIINHLVDLIKLFNNQNADILKEVLEQTLDKTELQSLNDFIQSETPHRLCKAIENKPSSCLELVKELLTKYKKDIFIIKDKLIKINAKLAERSTPKHTSPIMTTIKRAQAR